MKYADASKGNIDLIAANLANSHDPVIRGAARALCNYIEGQKMEIENSQREKREADVLAKEATKREEDLRTLWGDAPARVYELHQHVDRLERQVEKLGATPVA